MDRINPNAYHMLSIGQTQIANESDLILKPGVANRIRPGDGLLFGTWHEDTQVGYISGLAVVKLLDPQDNHAAIQYAETSLTLKPNPSGRRWWRNPHFKFAETVRERYMLDDIFAEHFPGYAELDITPLRQPTSPRVDNYQKIIGYIYVLQSKYGYKIGKTVNLRERTRLFGVKLPFKFDLIISGLVNNYSKVEADLHRQFGEKRLEGEWFELSSEDLHQIEEYLSNQDGA